VELERLLAVAPPRARFGSQSHALGSVGLHVSEALDSGTSNKDGNERLVFWCIASKTVHTNTCPNSVMRTVSACATHASPLFASSPRRPYDMEDGGLAATSP
jgi:hypothetical protein